MHNLVRLLQAETDTGPVPVEVRVGMPVAAGPDHFECHYDIHWPEGVYRSFAAGVDGLQALTLCQQKIAMELYRSDWHKAGRLSWPQRGEVAQGGYGFPAVKTMRADLVGYDKMFDG